MRLSAIRNVQLTLDDWGFINHCPCTIVRLHSAVNPFINHSCEPKGYFFRAIYSQQTAASVSLQNTITKTRTHRFFCDFLYMLAVGYNTADIVMCQPDSPIRSIFRSLSVTDLENARACVWSTEKATKYPPVPEVPTAASKSTEWMLASHACLRRAHSSRRSAGGAAWKGVGGLETTHAEPNQWAEIGASRCAATHRLNSRGWSSTAGRTSTLEWIVIGRRWIHWSAGLESGETAAAWNSFPASVKSAHGAISGEEIFAPAPSSSVTRSACLR